MIGSIFKTLVKIVIDRNFNFKLKIILIVYNFLAKKLMNQVEISERKPSIFIWFSSRSFCFHLQSYIFCLFSSILIMLCFCVSRVEFGSASQDFLFLISVFVVQWICWGQLDFDGYQ